MTNFIFEYEIHTYTHTNWIKKNLTANYHQGNEFQSVQTNTNTYHYVI